MRVALRLRILARRGCPCFGLLSLLRSPRAAANPFQAGANAELNKQLQQPALAGLWVYASGFAGLLLVAFVSRQLSPAGLGRAVAESAQVPWWAWLGGLISILSTVASLLFVQKLGSGLFTGLSITASIVVSVVLDQLGVLGFRQHTASPARMVGCALLIGGVWLVSRS